MTSVTEHWSRFSWCGEHLSKCAKIFVRLDGTSDFLQSQVWLKGTNCWLFHARIRGRLGNVLTLVRSLREPVRKFACHCPGAERALLDARLQGPFWSWISERITLACAYFRLAAPFGAQHLMRPNLLPSWTEKQSPERRHDVPKAIGLELSSVSSDPAAQGFLSLFWMITTSSESFF